MITAGSNTSLSESDTPSFIVLGGLKNDPGTRHKVISGFADAQWEKHQIRVSMDHWKLIFSRDSLRRDRDMKDKAQ